MIDKLLDRMSDYRVKVMERRANRLEKQFTAEERLAKIESERAKLRPDQPEQKKGKDLLNTLADFGEACNNAAEGMNNSMFGEPKKDEYNAKLELTK